MPTYRLEPWSVPEGIGLADITREEAERRRREKMEAETEEAVALMRDYGTLIPERGIPLDLEQFPFQEEWYSEEVARAREVIWMKAAQVGMSGYAWRWAFHRADVYGNRVIYFFPTDDDVADFGDQRIEPSIEDSEYLLRRIPASHVRHKHLKQVGSGFVSLRGTQSKSSVQSVDADAVIYDEYDYLHPKNVAQAERRTAGAQAAGREPRKRRLGYPTLPGYGISTYYAASDKRVWHVTCPECGLEQDLVWQKNMRWRTRPDGDVCQWGHDDYDEISEVHEAWRACRDCETSLEPPEGEALGPIHRGRWIATRPGANTIGFHVSRLIVPRTDLEELVQNSRRTKEGEQEAFWNNDLGLPWVAAEAALTEEDVRAAATFGGPRINVYRARRVVIGGLDVAGERNLTMAVSELVPEGRRAIWLGEPANFDEAADLMDHLRISLLVVDSNPERRAARALAAEFPGRVHLANYDDRNESDAFIYDAKKNMVRINRTEGLDAMMDSVRQQRYAPLQQLPPRYVSQMTGIARTVEYDTKGRPKRVYVSTGPDGDDYAHAETYNLVAAELWRLKQATAIGTQQAQVGTRVPDEQLGVRRRRRIDDYVPGRRRG